MPISAQVIADSISPVGVRITTLQLRYPRFIHAELMTHRVFSRNASSSRAIPVNRLIADMQREPALPVFWGSNKPGMQAGEELSREEIEACRMVWLEGMRNAIETAEKLRGLDLHKQIANRVLEPWSHINVIVTATEWENFFELRCHADAQPEIKALADMMRDAMAESEPALLHYGQWHLPYVTDEDRAEFAAVDTEPLLKLSVARCARVSYLTHDGSKPEAEKDFALYDRLVGSRPLHASPAEHQATPDLMERGGPSVPGITRDIRMVYANPDQHGNFNGWKQYRKQLEQTVFAGG